MTRVCSCVRTQYGNYRIGGIVSPGGNKEKEVKEELVRKLDELEALVENMDVPMFKRRNARWLSRNLDIRNSAHPDYDKAMVLIKELLANGVG